MKYILTLLLSAIGLQAGVVTFALTNHYSTALPSNTVAYVSLVETNNPNVNGGWLVVGNPRRLALPYGLGSTNLSPGAYKLEVDGLKWAAPLYFTVGTNASYTLAECIGTNAPTVFGSPPWVYGILSGDTSTATVTSNAGVYTMTVIGGGGATNGVTATQSTNIAAYQAKLATNTLAAAIPSTNGFINAQTGTNIARAQIEMVKTNDTVYAKSLTLYSPDNSDVVFARAPENESGWYLGTTFPGEIGEYTVSVGDQNDADGESSSVFGLGNITYANNSTIVGNQNIIGNAEPSGGNYYYAFGVANFMTQNNTNSGVIGNFNIVSPVESEKMLAIGVANEVYQGNSIAIGYGLHNTNAGTLDIGMTDATKATIGTNAVTFRSTVTAPAYSLGGVTITEWPAGDGGGITDATATNIAAHQAFLATNDLLVTSIALNVDNAFRIGGEDVLLSGGVMRFAASNNWVAIEAPEFRGTLRLGTNATITSEDGDGMTFSGATSTFEGSVVAEAFDGNGAALTNLNASYLSSGTVSPARMGTNVLLTGSAVTGTNHAGGVTTYTLTYTGGGGGASLSNTIPLAVTQSATNLWLNADASTHFDVTLTNNAILNITNTTSVFTNGEPRTIKFRRSGGTWSVYVTNSNIAFGQDITGINIGPSATSAAWVSLRWDSVSNRWDVVGNVSGF